MRSVLNSKLSSEALSSIFYITSLMKKNCSARKENDKPTFGAEKVFGDFDNKIWISRYIIISFPTDAIHETMTYYLNCIR